MTGPEAIAVWTELTGEKWKLLPCIVRDQACELVRAGFTREDMALVVKWTKREVGRGSKHSLLWRVLAEDNWQKFQERMELAEEALRRGWRPAFKVSAQPATVAGIATVRSPEQRASESLFAQGAVAMAEAKARLAGKTL